MDRLYGSILIVISVCIAAWALLHFHRNDTDVRPDKPDSALITSGPYRFTRNPLYIVLTLVQVTVAIWLDNLWILLLVTARLSLSLHAMPSAARNATWNNCSATNT